MPKNTEEESSEESFEDWLVDDEGGFWIDFECEDRAMEFSGK
jgi:hypothetical protein